MVGLGEKQDNQMTSIFYYILVRAELRRQGTVGNEHWYSSSPLCVVYLSLHDYPPVNQGFSLKISRREAQRCCSPFPVPLASCPFVAEVRLCGLMDRPNIAIPSSTRIYPRIEVTRNCCSERDVPCLYPSY